jgi:opacity protein-like surface antigen
MSCRTLYSTLLVSTALASPAFSADLPPSPVSPFAAPAYLEEWSGIYVGLEAGYGWGRQKLGSTSVGGFGGASDTANILNGVGDGVLFPEFTALSINNSISQRGGVFGGFAGAQKQFGNWVLGLEVDFDGASIRGSSNAFTVDNGVTVSSLSFGRPAVLSVTDPNQTRTNLTGVGFVAVPVTTNNFIIPNTTTVNAAPIPVTGQVAFGGTMAAQAFGITTPVNGITSTGTVQAAVLQQLQTMTNVTRTTSIDSKIDELGSARGKVGFTLTPGWLLYATGGLAFAHVENNIIATESFTADFGNSL